MLVYGVFETPRYMAEVRQVDSVWMRRDEARERARNRSYLVCGSVSVISWRANMPGSGKVLATFVDGTEARAVL